MAGKKSSRSTHRVAGFWWKVEVVAHERSEDGIEPVFLLGRQAGFYGGPGMIGLLPCSQDGEYVGWTFQGWQTLLDGTVGANEPAGGCAEAQFLFR